MSIVAEIEAVVLGGGVEPLPDDPSRVREAIAGLPGAQAGVVAIESELQARMWLAFAAARRWQPVRIKLRDRTTRSRGFPESAPDLARMRDWCVSNCRARWALEGVTVNLVDAAEAGATFWFEESAEAARFAMKWLPFKCT